MIIISTGYRSFDVRASSISKKSKSVIVLKSGKMYDMDTPYPHKEVVGEIKAAIENFMSIAANSQTGGMSYALTK